MINLIAILVHLMNVFLVEGSKVLERESLKEYIKGNWSSTMIMKWFMPRLEGSRFKWETSIPVNLKVLSENKHFHSTPKLSMEGVGFLKKVN